MSFCVYLAIWWFQPDGLNLQPDDLNIQPDGLNVQPDGLNMSIAHVGSISISMFSIFQLPKTLKHVLTDAVLCPS